jgi:hypothetical protein
MVSSKNCNDHRNHGGGLVEIDKAVHRLNSRVDAKHRATCRVGIGRRGFLMGHKWTSHWVHCTSALPPKADIAGRQLDVR